MPKIDTDGSGTIGRAEMLAAAAARFTRRDANGDGQLSGDEMRRPHKHRGHRGPRGHRGGNRGPGDMLKHPDTNAAGVVTRAAPEAARAARAAKTFDRLEANKDSLPDTD